VEYSYLFIRLDVSTRRWDNENLRVGKKYNPVWASRMSEDPV
jgi:hypothetical protein